MKKILLSLRKNILYLFIAAAFFLSRLSYGQVQLGYTQGSTKGVLNSPSPAQEAKFRKKENNLIKTIEQIGQGKNLDTIENTILRLKDDPDLVQTYGTTKIARFGELEYFALAQCQEKQGKKKQALESYRNMYNSHGADRTRERHMGLYALCALDNGYFNEARVVTQECIDAMRKHMAYGEEYKYITDVPVTSDTRVVRAHIYLLLSRGIAFETPACGWTEYGGPKTQEYLKKAIELGRGTTPNAYLRMAQYTRFSDPVQSRKYLEEMAKMYKKYPMHAEEARKRLKDYPPVENEKSAGK
jgi:hypothetical protein